MSQPTRPLSERCGWRGFFFPLWLIVSSHRSPSPVSAALSSSVQLCAFFAGAPVTLPDRHSLSAGVHQLHDEVLAEITASLSGALLGVAVSNDGWTDDYTKQYYLSISTTYVDFKRIEWRDSVVALTPVAGTSHAAAALTDVVRSRLSRVGVDTTRKGTLIVFVTDHAGSALNIARDGFGCLAFGCFAHAANLVSNHFLEPPTPYKPKEGEPATMPADFVPRNCRSRLDAHHRWRIATFVQSVSTLVSKFKMSSKATAALNEAIDLPHVNEQVIARKAKYGGRFRKPKKKTKASTSTPSSAASSSSADSSPSADSSSSSVSSSLAASSTSSAAAPSSSSAAASSSSAAPSSSSSPTPSPSSEIPRKLKQLNATRFSSTYNMLWSVAVLLPAVKHVWANSDATGISFKDAKIPDESDVELLEALLATLKPLVSATTLLQQHGPNCGQGLMLLLALRRELDIMLRNYPDEDRPSYWVAELLILSFDRWFLGADCHLRFAQSSLSPLYNPLPDAGRPDVQLPFDTLYYCPWSPFLFAFLCAVVDPRFASGRLTWTRMIGADATFGSWFPVGHQSGSVGKSAAWMWAYRALTNMAVWTASWFRVPDDLLPPPSVAASADGDDDADGLMSSGFGAILGSIASSASTSRSSSSSSSSDPRPLARGAAAASEKRPGDAIAPPPKKPSAKQFLLQRQAAAAAAAAGVPPSQRGRPKHHTDAAGIEQEVRSFLEHPWGRPGADPSLCRHDADPLLWWKLEGVREYPTLCLVALRLLSVCCTSAQDERNASAAGVVIDERGTRLAPERAEELVVARHYLRQLRSLE